MMFAAAMTELVVLVAVLLGAGAFGLWRMRTDGRTRVARSDVTDALSPDDIGAPLGERATLLQVSSAFCAPCKATRQVLGRVAEAVPGVAHVEVDAESKLDLVRRLDVRRTPTTLVLDGSGREVRRATGVPRADEVLAVLTEAVA
jgi:thiol-disulfide isomerase/thioredoxin